MPEPNQYKQTPGRALLAFAIVACLIAVFTVIDSRRRGSQEGIDLPTALGDKEWFEFGSFEPTEAVMEFGGQALYRQRAEPINRYDMFMFKRGRDDADRCFMYRYWNYKRDMKSPDGVYFVKVDDGTYMELTGQPNPRGGDPPATEDQPAE